jgi:hypothetical protein
MTCNAAQGFLRWGMRRPIKMARIAGTTKLAGTQNAARTIPSSAIAADSPLALATRPATAAPSAYPSVERSPPTRRRPSCRTHPGFPASATRPGRRPTTARGASSSPATPLTAPAHWRGRTQRRHPGFDEPRLETWRRRAGPGAGRTTQLLPRRTSQLAGLIDRIPELSRQLALELSGLDIAYRPTALPAHPLTCSRVPDLRIGAGIALNEGNPLESD